MKFISTLLLFMTSFITVSQTLQKHQWNNRIAIVLSDGLSNPLFQKQITALTNEAAACMDRKLIIYQVLLNNWRLEDFTTETTKEWKSTFTLFDQFMGKSHHFKVVLIGLDGNLKEERTDFFEPQELFSIIDGMSMRKAALRHKK
ncbi:DUF4174 domain-containing protein [Nonlabens sp. Ci31]|uniref:DUF4174 domain-containing protein n=1 Tax=Nonlabens sp. Ci31 TaxID=2608253 RepID=UPI0014637F74|nr:DUF4174 domain-containing protein [Nonlabens sp. Ci31]QJP34245.1 DUF4174 domain-containing protein [Nonlabens sp. Ci31]